MWGIWCVRSARSVLGPGEAWMKTEGRVETWPSKTAAEAQARHLNTTAVSPNVSYRAKEFEDGQ
jgi:hypothetical protein